MSESRIDRRSFVKYLSLGTSALAATTLKMPKAYSAEKVTTESLLELLQELIYARGPVGQEDEVRVICERELSKRCDKTWIDPAGNVIGHIKGKGKKGTPIVRITAHMDENAFMVKRVNSDGTLRVRKLGGIEPYNTGQGPVEILADSGIIPGIQSLGSMHTTAETSGPNAAKNDVLDWGDVFIFTRKTAAELDELGVHAGTRVVIARDRRKIIHIEDCVGGYFMDDRACIAIILGALSMLKESNIKPDNDIYIALTSQEEIGGYGAAYATSHLPGDVTIAVDVGPAAREYNVRLNAEPIIAYADGVGPYSKSVSNRMLGLARDLGMKPQTAAWESYGSDASLSKRYGHTGQSGLLCIATENTHGYEIIQSEGLINCSRLLTAYMEKPL